MSMRGIRSVIIGLLAFVATDVEAFCDRFVGSTMTHTGTSTAQRRLDFPLAFTQPRNRAEAEGIYPWRKYDFRTQQENYMAAVLSTVSQNFKFDEGRLVGTGTEEWWITPWLDVGTSGREPLMGLTRERGPDAGDLSETSPDGFQVWAVGFYNAPGAVVLGEIFEDKCNPSLSVSVRFPQDTVAIKFLFTDANPDEVEYLKGAPEYTAMIDLPQGTRDSNGDEIPATVENRAPRTVRLLQLDIAVKDRRARSTTDWVFGTFAWIGASQGDGLFDNLQPVSLQWGNDPGVYDENLSETWINGLLDGKLFGWEARPTLGFKGRANGPADNIRSSCLSCHAAAGRVPRSSHGLIGRISLNDFGDAEKVKAHVDLWFDNLHSREVFAPEQPYYASLDYSLQLDAAMFRMCTACRTGALSGPTPNVCRRAGFYNRSQCRTNAPRAFGEIMTMVPEAMNQADKSEKAMIMDAMTMPPPRQ